MFKKMHEFVSIPRNLRIPLDNLKFLLTIKKSVGKVICHKNGVSHLWFRVRCNWKWIVDKKNFVCFRRSFDLFFFFKFSRKHPRFAFLHRIRRWFQAILTSQGKVQQWCRKKTWPWQLCFKLQIERVESFAIWTGLQPCSTGNFKNQ